MFSLGKVLYEAATGKDRQEFPELPTLLRELPDQEGLLELNAVIARACRHDPKDRYTSAAAMRADSGLLQSGKYLARLHRTEKQLCFVQRAGAVVTAIAAVIALGWLWQVRQTNVVKELATQKDAASRESHQRLVQLQTANGVRAMDTGDPATAALWFAEVLKQSLGDKVAEQRERFRLGTLLRYMPKPVGLFHLDHSPESATFIDGGKKLLVVSKTPATGEHEGEIKVWDLASGRAIREINLTNIIGFKVSPLGHWAVVAQSDTKRLFKVEDGLEFAADLPFHGKGEWTIFAPDESKLAIRGYNDGHAVQVFEIPSGRPLTPLLVHGNQVTFLAFNPAGKQLVTCTRVDPVIKDPREPAMGPTGQARVWDATTGKPITDWLDLDEPVDFAMFSPDGKALVIRGVNLISEHSAFWTHVAKVFELPSGRLRFPLLTHKDSVLDAAFSPDGHCLATSCGDHTVTI